MQASNNGQKHEHERFVEQKRRDATIAREEDWADGLKASLPMNILYSMNWVLFETLIDSLLISVIKFIVNNSMHS